MGGGRCWTVAVVLAIVNAVWIAGGFRSEPASPGTPLRLALPLAPQLVPESAARPFAISSDGTRIVYVGRDSTGSSLYLQDLASGELKRLSETADADARGHRTDPAADQSPGAVLRLKALRSQSRRLPVGSPGPTA